MSQELKQLLDDIKTNTENMRSEIDAVKGKGLSEDDPLFKKMQEKMDNEFSDLKKKYEDTTQQLETEKKAREQVELKLQRGNFLGGETQEVETEEKKAERKAFEKFLRYGTGETSKASWDEQERKALSSLVDSEGGYLIPTDFESGIIKVAQDVAQIRGVANVGTTSRDRVEANKLTQRATIGWGTESVAVNPQDLQFGLEDMPINEITALVLIPNSTLEDAESDIFSELTMVFGEDIAAEEDNQFIIGNGVKKPEGILTNANVQSNYVATGVAGALSDANNNGVDALINAQYKVKAVYRRRGTWAFNSLTEAEVRKLKDSNGQYLWQPPVQAGAPAQLLGRPIVNPEGAPDIASGAFPVLFGDFKRGYRIRDRKGMTVQRLVERYAEYRQTGFLVTKRVGGQVVLDEAFSCVKVATS